MTRFLKHFVRAICIYIYIYIYIYMYIYNDMQIMIIIAIQDKFALTKFSLHI